MFEPLDPNIARALIEQEPDILSEAAKKEAEFYANVSCPMCYQSGAQKRIPTPKIVVTEEGWEVVNPGFSPNKPLPEGYAHCLHCGTDFNPHTGLIRSTEVSIIAGSESGHHQP